MVASCLRRIGNFQKALKIYQAIYQDYPDNMECLKFLTLLCRDMGLDYEEYARRLREIEIENEAINGFESQEPQPEPEEHHEQPVRISKDNTRMGRQQQNTKKPEKNDDNWGGDIGDVDLGV